MAFLRSALKKESREFDKAKIHKAKFVSLPHDLSSRVPIYRDEAISS